LTVIGALTIFSDDDDDDDDDNWQDAQLSQRGRTMLHVVENLAVTQGRSRSFEIALLSKPCVLCKFLLVLHPVSVSILYSFTSPAMGTDLA